MFVAYDRSTFHIFFSGYSWNKHSDYKSFNRWVKQVSFKTYNESINPLDRVIEIKLL